MTNFTQEEKERELAQWVEALFRDLTKNEEYARWEENKKWLLLARELLKSHFFTTSVLEVKEASVATEDNSRTEKALTELTTLSQDSSDGSASMQSLRGVTEAGVTDLRPLRKEQGQERFDSSTPHTASVQSCSQQCPTVGVPKKEGGQRTVAHATNHTIPVKCSSWKADGNSAISIPTEEMSEKRIIKTVSISRPWKMNGASVPPKGVNIDFTEKGMTSKKFKRNTDLHWIAERILTEYKKHGKTLPDEWHKIAATKITGHLLTLKKEEKGFGGLPFGYVSKHGMKSGGFPSGDIHHPEYKKGHNDGYAEGYQDGIQDEIENQEEESK